MKLIPMTDFVLQYKADVSTNNEDKIMDAAYAMIGYANFLKQELTLGMFVPVDEKGNVLEEPHNDGMNDMYFGAAMDAYNEAKSKVLFDHKFTVSTKGSHSVVFNNTYQIINGLTIEHLVKYDLTLTDHAKSLIF